VTPQAAHFSSALLALLAVYFGIALEQVQQAKIQQLGKVIGFIKSG
jgi:hypothetical protein